MAWQHVQAWLAGTRVARHAADLVLRTRARHRIVEQELLSPVFLQERALRHLIDSARHTQFGRSHEFARIRTADDFRRLVPLRNRADFWDAYWLPSMPQLGGVTWPGPIPLLAASDPEAPGPRRYTPFPAELAVSFRQAARTVLHYAVLGRPRAHLLSGSFLLVGDTTPTSPLAEDVWAGSLETLLLHDLPRSWQPFVAGPPRLGLEDGWPPAGQLSSVPITAMAGDSYRLSAFVAKLRERHGQAPLVEIWPRLELIVFTRRPGGLDKARLVTDLGLPAAGRPLVLEVILHPEGMIAVEDPRHGCLRLLTDVGVYYEFVPVEQLGQTRLARHHLGEVEPGVVYAPALSSPAGVWACLVGTLVCFEKRHPPLLRLVRKPRSAGR